MSFQIQRGLFLFDFIDHHAILGIPVDAEVKDIRKRYLKIARRLHPDSFVSEDESAKQRASELLSKLVNPAWEKLSQEKERVEYGLLLKLKGQQALRQPPATGELSSLAQQLSTASNPDHFYVTSLKSLADRQYDQLDQSVEMIAQISELNMVYLMRKESQGGLNLGETKKTLYTGSNLPDSTASGTVPDMPRPTQPIRRESPADQYYRRAEGYAAKNNFAQAVLELRDALQIDPRNSRCHALLGMIYFKQNQAKMAKIHLNKSLELDPNNQMAVEGKRRLEQAEGASGTAKPAAKAPPKASNPNDKPGGGMFGGLFGGKKK